MASERAMTAGRPTDTTAFQVIKASGSRKLEPATQPKLLLLLLSAQ